LVVRTDRLGDVVLTLPLLPLLRHRFPHAFIAMLTGHYAGELVEGNPFIDELLRYDDGSRMIPFGTMRRILRERRFDAAVVVHPTGRIARLIVAAGIPVRVGTGYRVYSLLFNRRVYTHRKTAERHEAEYNCGLLEPLGCPVPSGKALEFTIAVPEEAGRAADAILRESGITPADRFAVVHPGSGGSAREWPLESFGRLAARLTDRFSMRVLVTGVAAERAQVDAVIAHSGGKATGLAGKLRVKELAAVLRRAAIVVSNSTGPLHIAVALGTPVLGFYPQIPVMGPRRWGPYTSNARVLVPDKPPDCADCTGKQGSACACMASISVDRAAAAAAELLEPATVRPALHGS
jgi:heptosyltransferase-3